MRKLKILYTSDVHGYLFPTNYASTDVLPQGLFKLEAAFRPDGNTPSQLTSRGNSRARIPARRR